MSDTYNFVFPLPPSVNHYLKNYHRTPKTQAYFDECALIANQVIDAPLEGELIVVITVDLYNRGHRRDIDSFAKVSLDALNGIAWHDDSQIVELHIYGKTDKISIPSLELSVWSKSP